MLTTLPLLARISLTLSALAAALFIAGCDGTAASPKPAPVRVQPPAQTTPQTGPQTSPQTGPQTGPASTTPAPAERKPLPTSASDWTGKPEEAKRVDVGPLSFAVPTGWQPRPPAGTMRLAEMLVPASEKTGSLYNPETDGIVAFFRLGGSVEDNVARWAASVTGADGKAATPNIAVSQVAGLKVHDVQMQGTYLDGMPGGQRTSREGWGFRAAIIETGLPLTFIRMTGPKALMEANAEKWDALLKSMQVKDAKPAGHP